MNRRAQLSQRRLSGLSLIACLAVPAAVEPQATQPAVEVSEDSAKKPLFRFEAGHSTPPIPFHLASNKVHLSVAVDGRAEPVWFLLDSGANISILDRELTAELGLELRNESTADTAAGGRSFWFAFTNGPAMTLPGLELAAKPLAVIERRTQPANGHPSRGLLGADQFQRFTVDIDYPARTIRFHDPDHFVYEGPGTALPVEIDANGKALLDVVVIPRQGDPIAGRVSVDTGGRGTLTLNAPFVEEHALIERTPGAVMTTVGVGVGGEVRHYLGRLRELRFGPFALRDLPATLAPMGTKGAYGRAEKAGVLDAEVLTRFRVIFDYARSRIIFEPGSEVGAPFEADMSGTFLTAAGPGFDTPTVMSVQPGSPAATAGLEVGDELISIDGEPCSSRTLDEVRALLKTDGVTRRLTIRRGDATLEAEIRLRRLV